MDDDVRCNRLNVLKWLTYSDDTVRRIREFAALPQIERYRQMRDARNAGDDILERWQCLNALTEEVAKYTLLKTGLPSKPLFEFGPLLEAAAFGLFDLPEGPDLADLNRTHRAALVIVESLRGPLFSDNGTPPEKPKSAGSGSPAVKSRRKQRGHEKTETLTARIQNVYCKALLDLSTRGTVVPTEAQLAERFECAASTVNRAIARYKQLAANVMKEDLADDGDRLGYDEAATRNRVLRNMPRKSSL